MGRGRGCGGGRGMAGVGMGGDGGRVACACRKERIDFKLVDCVGAGRGGVEAGRVWMRNRVWALTGDGCPAQVGAVLVELHKIFPCCLLPSSFPLHTTVIAQQPTANPPAKSTKQLSPPRSFPCHHKTSSWRCSTLPGVLQMPAVCPVVAGKGGGRGELL